MLKLNITPRFCELDGLGHINNAVFLEWFEQARIPIFKIFTPDLAIEKWRLIIARNEIDYLHPVKIDDRVFIHTVISKLGKSSMTIEHICFANDIKAAKGSSVMIHYDYKLKKSQPIEDQERQLLSAYLI